MAENRILVFITAPQVEKKLLGLPFARNSQGQTKNSAVSLWTHVSLITSVELLRICTAVTEIKQLTISKYFYDKEVFPGFNTFINVRS